MTKIASFFLREGRLAAWLYVVALWLVMAPIPSAQAAAAWSLSASASGTPARLSLSGELVVAAADRGLAGTVFVAALLPDASLYALANGRWSRVTDATPPAYLTGVLGTHTLNVLSSVDVTALAGTVVYVGYGSSFQDMLNRQQFDRLYTVPGSMSGPATAGDWLTFSINVQDFAYPDRSAATVDRIVTLHESHKVPVDIYLTDNALATFETSYPDLITRLRGSPYVALNYHIRPPKPYYAAYDWAGLSALAASDQVSRIRIYESHVTDLATGQPGATTGGFARLKQLTDDHPVIAAFQADAALYAPVAQVFRELGASMTISHSAPYINLGTTTQGLSVRPEHYDLKLFESPGQSAARLIEAGFAAAHATAGAASPYVVGVKMHDNDFFARASAWTNTYINAPRTPPWDITTRAGLKSDADMQAQWTLYEEAVAWADSNRSRVAAANAWGLGAALAAAPATPLLYVSGTMHIESNRLRWPNPDKLLAFFRRATAAGKVGSQGSGMRWSIGADVGWLDNEPRAGEIIRTLGALGVEWDIHVHSAADRTLAAQKIVALGGTPNNVLSGVIVTDIDSLRSPLAGSGGYTWQADSLWGLARAGNHGTGSEDLSNGLWQPRSNSEWQAHDPAAGLAVVGGGSRTLSAAEALAEKMAQGARGGYTAPVYSATLMLDQVTLTVADAVTATTTTDGIDQIEAFAGRVGLLPHVRWASLSGSAAAWRAAGSVPSRIANTQ